MLSIVLTGITTLWPSWSWNRLMAFWLWTLPAVPLQLVEKRRTTNLQPQPKRLHSPPPSPMFAATRVPPPLHRFMSLSRERSVEGPLVCSIIQKITHPFLLHYFTLSQHSKPHYHWNANSCWAMLEAVSLRVKDESTLLIEMFLRRLSEVKESIQPPICYVRALTFFTLQLGTTHVWIYGSHYWTFMSLLPSCGNGYALTREFHGPLWWNGDQLFAKGGPALDLSACSL